MPCLIFINFEIFKFSIVNLIFPINNFLVCNICPLLSSHLQIFRLQLVTDNFVVNFLQKVLLNNIRAHPAKSKINDRPFSYEVRIE